jgi:large subunit ribosomal protein L25
MEKIKLNVKEREAKTPNQLRREAQLPATLYGPGEPSTNLQIEEKEFISLPSAAHSHMIELDFGAQKTVNAIIRNVQRKASTSKIMNIELYKVRLDRKLTVTVPLKYVGVSEAVTQGGQLVEVNLEAEIECFPGDIPDTIEVDLSQLKEIDQSIHFGDLKISDKVEILNPLDEIIVKVITPREIVEEVEEKPAVVEAIAGAPVEGAAPPPPEPEAQAKKPEEKPKK